MPPINQQRSATGLIVALVAFVILFVVSAIFAMVYYNQLKVANSKNEDQDKEFYTTIPRSWNSPTDPTVSALKAARSENPPKFTITGNDPLLEVATKQRDALVAEIEGATGTFTASSAVDDVSKKLVELQSKMKSAGVTIDLTSGPPNLLLAMDGLESAAENSAKAAAAARTDLAAEVAAHARDMHAIETANKQYKETADTAAASNSASIKTVNDSLDANKSAQQKIADDEAAQAKALTDAQAKFASDQAALQAQIEKDKLLIAALQVKLGNRHLDSSRSIVTQVDGQIIRAAGKDVCYINLGLGQQVSPGLTFEVYERATGVPPIPANANGDESLPVGKASIEVTKVGDNSSECRVVHLEPGAVLTEGDPIANLVYDPHIKFKFFVYGDFDMSQSGRPSPADADVIRRLITQWGAELTDKIDVNTDFVVFGAEPQLPSFTKDELTDPLNQHKLDVAQAALDEYSLRRQTAIDYHIPILNQNRFLYYVGFYDQSKR